MCSSAMTGILRATSASVLWPLASLTRLLHKADRPWALMTFRWLDLPPNSWLWPCTKKQHFSLIITEGGREYFSLTHLKIPFFSPINIRCTIKNNLSDLRQNHELGEGGGGMQEKNASEQDSLNNYGGWPTKSNVCTMWGVCHLHSLALEETTWSSGGSAGL